MVQTFIYQNYTIKLEYSKSDDSIQIQIEDLDSGEKYSNTIKTLDIEIKNIKKFYTILLNGLESKPNYYVKINPITHESKNKLAIEVKLNYDDLVELTDTIYLDNIKIVMLKAVPRHLKITDHPRKNVETDVFSHVEDPRWIFLNAPENRDKYYYIRRGGPNQIVPARCVDCGPPPVYNILEPLGRFTRVELVNPYYSNLRDNYVHYWIWFENSVNTSQRVSENDQLYYTDEPPTIRSVPLTINDIPIESVLDNK